MGLQGMMLPSIIPVVGVFQSAFGPEPIRAGQPPRCGYLADDLRYFLSQSFLDVLCPEHLGDIHR